ncbi:MAG TPA: carboxypeptidase-like regulatory domain-containing protein, partial [Niabella sp.]|nr:carboxypeptidase-like regulatory domain-containing protein [Niabella sp.]
MEKFSFVQEFKMLPDSNWFVSREKIIVDVAPIGNKTPGVIGRKSSTYKNIIVNDSSVTNRLMLNKVQEEVVTLAGAMEKPKNYWDTARHEGLSKTEKGIIKMIDTLINTPSYQKITKQVVFLTTGYVDVGNVQLGSAFNWFSGNAWEDFRTRFDVASNTGFNRKLRYHAYLAYGFSDKKFKGQGELFYLPKKDPRQYWHLGYRNDLDFGQNYYGEISQDNIFTFAIRKPNIPKKYINLEKIDFEFFNELRSGFSTLLSINNEQYRPL